MSEITSFSDLAIEAPESTAMEGPKIDIQKLFGRKILVHRFVITDSKYPEKGNDKCLHLQISLDGNKRVVFTGSRYLMNLIQKVPADRFPFSTIIVKKDNDSLQFT